MTGGGVNIGINADEANVESPVGIGQFALNVIRNLEKIDKINKYFIYLTSRKNNNLPNAREGWLYKYIWPKKLSTQIALPFNLLLNREKIDVFYTPTHYAPRICPMPSVISIMDVSYLMFPDYFAKKDLMQLKNWTEYSVRQAKKVVVISESTKRDVIKYYGKKEEDVAVCYPGFQKEVGSRNYELRIDDIKNKYKIIGEYIIAIGTLQPRKNYERLIRAFANLKKFGIKEKLVIVGKKGWLYDSIFSLVRKLKLEKDVIFTGYASHDEVRILLSNAKIYVLASLYEGFGIPVLEAQASGVACLISRVSSLPEVGAETVLYFNPLSEADIAENMRKLLSETFLRDELIRLGRENAKRFNWEKCAREVLEVIKSAV